MGSWSVYCGISNISITSGNECVLLPLKKNKSHQGYLPYLPATLPIFGKYDDYGGLEDIKEDENTKLLEKHFGVDIYSFCQFFTRGLIDPDDEKVPKNIKNHSELKDWNFMFIDKQVYDFMSKHLDDNTYGEHDLGNHGLLKELGAKYLGEFPSRDKRFKHFWDLNGLELKSDKTWIYTSKDNQLIYTYNPKQLVEVLSEEKIKLLKKPEETLWRIYGKEYCSQHIYWILGVSSNYNDVLELVKSMSDKKREEFLKKMGVSTKLTINRVYISKFDTFGDDISKLIRIRHNMHCFSQYFSPYVLYMTPQCGEHNLHAKVLDKFSEINKSYIYVYD